MIKRISWFATLGLAFSLGFIQLSWAEEIHSKDGSMQKGEIIPVQGGTFIVQSRYGQLQIPAEDISAIAFAQGADVTKKGIIFANGDQMMGSLVEAKEGRFIFQSPHWNLIVEDKTQLKTVNFTLEEDFLKGKTFDPRKIFVSNDYEKIVGELLAFQEGVAVIRTDYGQIQVPEKDLQKIIFSGVAESRVEPGQVIFRNQGFYRGRLLSYQDGTYVFTNDYSKLIIQGEQIIQSIGLARKESEKLENLRAIFEAPSEKLTQEIILDPRRLFILNSYEAIVGKLLTFQERTFLIDTEYGRIQVSQEDMERILFPGHLGAEIKPNQAILRTGSYPAQLTSYKNGIYIFENDYSQLVIKQKGAIQAIGIRERAEKTGALQAVFPFSNPLKIVSYPSGAEVYLQEKLMGITRKEQEVGTTPLLLNNLIPGDYKIIARDKRGLSKEKLVQVKQEGITTVEFSFLPPGLVPLTEDIDPISCLPLKVKNEKDGSEMALIPAGEFLMGSTKGDSNEKPVHPVHLDAYYIDKYEVSNKQYREFVEATGHIKPKFWDNSNLNQPTQPVVGVSWEDAVAYAEWCGKRLPTEAEWEKAARGGLVGKKYPGGDSVDTTKANYYDASVRRTTRVGNYPPNPYGLFDMAGNVWEWCSDWYRENYYAASPSNNSKGPNNASYYVCRGGCWYNDAGFLRCAYRHHKSPQDTDRGLGFRCAKSP